MIKKYCGLLIFFILFFSSPISWGKDSTDDAARRHILRGISAVEMAKSSEDFADAAAEFKKATELAPQMPNAWYNLGVAYANMGHYRESINSFQRFLALAPHSKEASEVRDRIVKLEYRIEKTETFHNLSGTWFTLDGQQAIIITDGDKTTITLAEPFHYRNTCFDSSISDPNCPQLETADSIFNLQFDGNKLTGTAEITPRGANRYTESCTFPYETADVKAKMDGSRLKLAFQKKKYEITDHIYLNVFSDASATCSKVTPTGFVSVEIELIGPAGAGRINADFKQIDGTLSIENNRDSKNGLQDNDRILSVNGITLAQFPSAGEKLVKLSGQPGSTIDLVIERVSGGLFSKKQTEKLRIPVQLKTFPPSR